VLFFLVIWNPSALCLLRNSASMISDITLLVLNMKKSHTALDRFSYCR
jgi:hypothetical protein